MTTDTTPRFADITVQLTGRDGNAYAILGAVQKALHDAGVSAEVVSEYVNEATSHDYARLLRTTMRWVTVR